jgi:hypothetical protein
MMHKNEFKADPSSQWETVEEGRLDQENINQNQVVGARADRPQSQENSYASNQ